MASRQRLRLRGAAAEPPAPPAPPAAQPPAPLVLGTLPAELALAVLLRLPLKERCAAEAVCRGWRAALRAPELWAHVDLSPLGSRAGDDLATALAARGGAALRSLDASSCSLVSVAALLRCAEAAGRHPGARLAVRAPASWWSAKQIDDALAAYPHLTLVDVECYADSVDASLLSALRSGRAGVRLLLLSHWGAADAAPGAPPRSRALAAALTGHPTLLRLELDDGTFGAEEIAALVRELRAARAAAVAGPATSEDGCAAEAEAEAVPPPGPGVLREVALHGATRAAELWELHRLLSAPGAADAAALAAVGDITVMAKHVRSPSVSEALLGALRSRRVGMRELVLEFIGDASEPGETYLISEALAAALRHAVENYPEASLPGEAASPRAATQQQAAAMLLPAAAVATPAPAPPLPGAAALTGLSIADCGLDPLSAAVLLEALPAACRCLEALNICNNLLVDPFDASAPPPAAALRTKRALRALMRMPALRELTAERCGIEDCAASGIALGLIEAAEPGGHNACARLLLAHNAIGDGGARALATALRALHPVALEELDLSENCVGGEGGAALALALFAGSASLRDLRAHGNCGGGAAAVPALVALLDAGPACAAAADAAGELGDAAFDSAEVQDALVAAGAVPALLALLAQPAEEPRGVALACEEAAWALWAVASESAANRAALVAAGAIPRLAATLAAAGAGALSVPAAPPPEGVGARNATAAARDVTEKVCAVLWCLASTDAARRDIAAAPGVIDAMLRLAELPPGASPASARWRRSRSRDTELADDIAAQLAGPSDGPAAAHAGAGGDADAAHVHAGAHGFWVMVGGEPAAPVPAPSSQPSSDDLVEFGSDSEGDDVGFVGGADALGPPGFWGGGGIGGTAPAGARLRLMSIGALTALALSPGLRAGLRAAGLLRCAEDLARVGPPTADAATAYQALLAVLLLAAPRAGGPQPPPGDAELARELLRATPVGRRAPRHLAATLSATLASARSSEPRDRVRPPAPDEGLYLECTWTVEEAAQYIRAAAQVCPATAAALLRRHRCGELLALALRSGAGGPAAAVSVCHAVQALAAAAGAPGRDALRRDGAVRALRAAARAASGAAGRAPPRAAPRAMQLPAEGDEAGTPPDVASVAAAARACLDALDASAEHRSPKGRARKS